MTAPVIAQPGADSWPTSPTWPAPSPSPAVTPPGAVAPMPLDAPPAFRRYTITSDPFGWFMGIYGLSATVAITAHLAIRADVNKIAIGVFSDYDGFEYGLTAMLFLLRTYHGPFLEGGVLRRGWTFDCNDCDPPYGSAADTGPELLIGDAMTLDNGFTLSAAIGAAHLRSFGDLEGHGNYEGSFYVRAGYAF